MCDNSNSGVIQVEPGGNLPVSDDEDVSHPGGVFLHWAQRVTELLVVLESAGWDVFILFRLKRKKTRRKEEMIDPNQKGHSVRFKDKKNQSYLWDGSEIPEQVARADG